MSPDRKSFWTSVVFLVVSGFLVAGPRDGLTTVSGPVVLSKDLVEFCPDWHRPQEFPSYGVCRKGRIWVYFGIPGKMGFVPLRDGRYQKSVIKSGCSFWVVGCRVIHD